MNPWLFGLLFVTPIVVAMLVQRVRYRKMMRRRMAEQLHAQFREEIGRRLLEQLSGEEPPKSD